MTKHLSKNIPRGFPHLAVYGCYLFQYIPKPPVNERLNSLPMRYF
jgi:hypothetical protein